MDTTDSRQDQSASKEEALRPTFAPVAMAMGIAMSVWGLMTLTLNINALWFMFIAGIGLSTWALQSWIKEIVLSWESNR